VTEKLHPKMIYLEICPNAKGVLGLTGIFFISSRHVESIILMTYWWRRNNGVDTTYSGLRAKIGSKISEKSPVFDP